MIKKDDYVVPIDNKERKLCVVTSISNGVVSGYDCRTAYHFDFDENKEGDKFENHYREATNGDIILYSFPELSYSHGIVYENKDKQGIFGTIVPRYATVSETWWNTKYEDKN